MDTLVHFQQEVVNGLEEKGCVVATFFDLKRAFDSVPHAGLLGVLRQGFAVPPVLLRWLHSYLTGRRQRVRVGSCFSDWRPVLSGVPQGSVLGPLLFAAYINSVASLPFRGDAKVIMYADDLVLVQKVNACPSQEAAIQYNINLIHYHFQTLLLTLHPTKTKFLIFSYSNSNLTFQLTIGEHRLEQVSYYKYLGVTFDSRLEFGRHAAIVSASSKRKMFAIRRILRKSVDSQEVFHRLYKSVVLPSLLYAIEVWSPYSNRDMNLLESCNKLACRMVLNNFCKFADYDALCTGALLPKIELLCNRRRVILLFQYYFGMRFCNDSLLTSRDNITSSAVSTRSSNPLRLYNSFYRKDHSQNCFVYSAVQIWNFLLDNYLLCPMPFRAFRKIVSCADFSQL